MSRASSVWFVSAVIDKGTCCSDSVRYRAVTTTSWSAAAVGGSVSCGVLPDCEVSAASATERLDSPASVRATSGILPDLDRLDLIRDGLPLRHAALTPSGLVPL